GQRHFRRFRFFQRAGTEDNARSLVLTGNRQLATTLRESDLHIGALLQMDAVNEPYASRFQRQNHRRSPRAFAEEADALEQRAFGHAGGRENQLLAWRQVFGFINLVLVFDAHLGNALFQFRLVDYQPALHVSVQAANRRRRDYALRRAARAHHRVHSGSDHGRGDASRQIAVADQPDARARLADIGDQFFVPWPVEHDHYQIFHAAMHSPRNVFEIDMYRRVEFHGVLARRSDNDLFHVAVRSMQQSALFRSRQHRDCARRAGSAQVRPFERIDRDIDVRNFLPVGESAADMLANIEHGRLIALALADHDGAVHR